MLDIQPFMSGYLSIRYPRAGLAKLDSDLRDKAALQ
jgi:hypothetical protein